LLTRRLRQFRPDVIFIEQEPFVVSAFQWAWAAHRARVPYGVTQYENLSDRGGNPLLRRLRAVLLRHAAFVVARSPTAMNLTRAWGASGAVDVIPPALSRSVVSHRRTPRSSEIFSVGFAGRLVPEKGVLVLLEALRQLQPPLQLHVIGDGPLRAAVDDFGNGACTVQVTTGVRHDDVARHLDQLDVLCLPSLTTQRWAEQFGRVITEATALGVPVIGTDSGEIPWVIEQTGGGLVVPEGDAASLAAAITRLRDDDALRQKLGENGRERTLEFCSAEVCAARLSSLFTTAAAPH
jgi:glycosyltransferase involved in cell wall biosynthesis